MPVKEHGVNGNSLPVCGDFKGSVLGDILFIDFETRSAVDLKKSGADVYARDPSTDVNCFAWAFNDEPIVCDEKYVLPCDRVIDHVADGGSVVAHNCAFEWLIWNKCWKNRAILPELKWEQLTCTMEMAYAMALPGALERVAPAIGLKFEKDKKGQRIMLQLAQPMDFDYKGDPIWYEPYDFQEKFQALYEYCKMDVEVERELYKRLLPLSAFEKKVSELTHKINQRGISIDLKALHSAQQIIEHEKERLDKAIRKASKNAIACCTETARITQWIKGFGIEVDGIAKEDITELLSLDDLPDQVREVLLIRQEAAKTSVAKVISAISSVCADGRLRSIHQYSAASTRRWGGRRIQPQNLPRPTLPQNAIEHLFEILGSMS